MNKLLLPLLILITANPSFSSELEDFLEKQFKHNKFKFIQSLQKYTDLIMSTCKQKKIRENSDLLFQTSMSVIVQQEIFIKYVYEKSDFLKFSNSVQHYILGYINGNINGYSKSRLDTVASLKKTLSTEEKLKYCNSSIHKLKKLMH